MADFSATISGYLKRRNIYLLFFVLLTYLLAFLPVWTGLITSWLHSEDNSQGILIVPIVIYMLWKKRGELAMIPLKGSNVGGFFFLVSLLLYIASQAGGALTLASLSLVSTLVSGLWFLLGASIVRACAFPLFFLLFMIPIPSQIYAALTGPLQLFVTQVACKLLKLSGVFVYNQGNVIYHTKQVFQVVQACSGLRSITTMVTLGAVIGYFSFDKAWLRTLLILFGIPVAVMANIFRVYTLVFAFDWKQINLVEGVAHTILGLVVFVFAVMIFALIHKGLSRWNR